MRWPVGLSMVLIVAAAALPASDFPFWAGLLAAVALAALAGSSVRFDRGRALVGLAASGWIAAVVIHGGHHDLTVLLAALLLRLWAGVPELLRLGSAFAPDLLIDLAGGTAAGVLVLEVAQSGQTPPASTLLVGVVATLVLGFAGAHRLRQ